jgi:hypothetical protein
MAISRPDFSAIPDEAVDEIFRNGETCLLGTIALATAADQRATTMAGIFGAGSVALLAMAATLKASASGDSALVLASSITALLFFVSALICAWSARPVDFFVGGYEPSKLAECAGDPMWMKRYASEDIQVRIDSNRKTLERAASLLSFGAIVAAAAPLIGTAAYFIHLYGY